MNKSSLSVYITYIIPLGLIGLAIIGYMLNHKKTKKLMLETCTNMGIFLGFQIFMQYARGFNQTIFTHLKVFSLGQIESAPLVFVLCFLLVDFTYYWVHRLSHKFPFLWSMHSVHHSSNEFNFSTALRLPWFAPFFNWVFYIPLVLIGLPLKYIAVSHILNLWFQFFVHTKMIHKLGCLDHVFNSPANHRVHHSREVHYLDRNFGGVFMIWDKLFGTYQYEKQEVKDFGIIGEPINSHNPIVVNLKPLIHYINHEYKKYRTGRRR